MTKTMLLATAAAFALAAGSAGEAPPLRRPAARAAGRPGADPDRSHQQGAAGRRGPEGRAGLQPRLLRRPAPEHGPGHGRPGAGLHDPTTAAGSRGFEGAVGNILINNNRPASKNDAGSDVLERTPADQVDRIELIRGGAPGIDMQGYAVVVNVILKTAASRQSIVT
jgi:hypothetical protein